MRSLVLPLSLLLIAAAPPPEIASWRAQAAKVTITRDDFGIAHISGMTDADAVFGMIYAQAEDDFPRIEANYLTALGRTAEAAAAYDNAIGSPIRYDLELADGRYVDSRWAARTALANLNEGRPLLALAR